MKKLLAILCVFGLFAGSMVGCGDTKKVETKKVETKSTETTKDK